MKAGTSPRKKTHTSPRTRSSAKPAKRSTRRTSDQGSSTSPASRASITAPAARQDDLMDPCPLPMDPDSSTDLKWTPQNLLEALRKQEVTLDWAMGRLKHLAERADKDQTQLQAVKELICLLQEASRSRKDEERSERSDPFLRAVGA